MEGFINVAYQVEIFGAVKKTKRTCNQADRYTENKFHEIYNLCFLHKIFCFLSPINYSLGSSFDSIEFKVSRSRKVENNL